MKHRREDIQKVERKRLQASELAKLYKAADEEDEKIRKAIARGNYYLQDGCHNCSFYCGVCDERAYARVDEAGICDLYQKKEEEEEEA